MSSELLSPHRDIVSYYVAGISLDPDHVRDFIVMEKDVDRYAVMGGNYPIAAFFFIAFS
jgi:hypothetical protein